MGKTTQASRVLPCRHFLCIKRTSLQVARKLFWRHACAASNTSTCCQDPSSMSQKSKARPSNIIGSYCVVVEAIYRILFFTDLDEKCLTNFSVSPDDKFLVFLGQQGSMHLFSAQVIFSKMLINFEVCLQIPKYGICVPQFTRSHSFIFGWRSWFHKGLLYRSFRPALKYKAIL